MNTNSDQVEQEKNPGGVAELSPRPAQEYVSVPTKAYERFGQGYLDVREQLQALWDAVFLTHPHKEKLLRAYVQRIDQLRGGASPMLSDTAVQLEELARTVNAPEAVKEVEC